jgi:hypothetical protein
VNKKEKYRKSVARMQECGGVTLERLGVGIALSDDRPDRAIVPHFPFGMHENISVTSLTFSNLSAQRGTRPDHWL